ncbi:MAG: hypothetical protein WBA92_03430 [Pseudorhodobacter sp.]
MRLAYAAEECGDKAGTITAIKYSVQRETYVRLTQMIGGKPTVQGKYWQELLGQVGGRTRHPMLDSPRPKRLQPAPHFRAADCCFDMWLWAENPWQRFLRDQLYTDVFYGTCGITVPTEAMGRGFCFRHVKCRKRLCDRVLQP